MRSHSAKVSDSGRNEVVTLSGMTNRLLNGRLDDRRPNENLRTVYPKDMPPSLPLSVLVRKFLWSIVEVGALVLRAVVVLVAWLAFLPWVTICIFRGLFAGGTTA
jgi:hypothetical protein